MTAVLSPLPCPSPGLAARPPKLAAWTPFPKEFSGPPAPGRLPPPPLPVWPTDASLHVPTFFPSSWPPPFTVLPAPTPERTTEPTPFAENISPLVAATAHKPFAPVASPSNFKPVEDFTDDDLCEAFAPIVEHAVRNAVSGKEFGIDTNLEPMLRSTIRRSLAEYAPSSKPFQPPGTVDRFLWHMQAMFTSRTYEDILFEKTHRFQVEEVYLVDVSTLALVSFASCDPARHASAKRITPTVQRLAIQLRDDSGIVRQAFELADGRNVIARSGQFVILMAIVRGQAGELIFADLEFALRRIEDHFKVQFQRPGSPLLHALQPFLEDCLLIQSPASAA